MPVLSFNDLLHFDQNLLTFFLFFSENCPKSRLNMVVAASLKSALQRYHDQQKQLKEKLDNECK